MNDAAQITTTLVIAYGTWSELFRIIFFSNQVNAQELQEKCLAGIKLQISSDLFISTAVLLSLIDFNFYRDFICLQSRTTVFF